MRFKPLTLALLLLSPPLAAAEEASPSLELLEYLGGWEDAEGNWLDPLSLDTEALDLAQDESETDDEQDDN